MKSNNFKEVIENFLKENLEHKYAIEKYGLRDNYPEDLIVEAYTGGATGGSYDGRRGVEFTKEKEEILDNLISSVNYTISNSELVNFICVPIEENIRQYITEKISTYDDIGESSGGGDYYGNYSIEKIYAINLKDILEVLLTPEDYQIFLEVLPENTQKLNDEFQDTETKKKIQKLEKQITDFSKNSAQEKAKLQKDMTRHQKLADDLKKTIESFDKNQTKKLKSLNDELNKIKPSAVRKTKP